MRSLRALSHAQYVLINRLSIPLGAFIILVIIGRHSDALLGQYALVMTFFYIMQMLPLLGLTSYIMREVSRAPEDAGRYYISIGTLSLLGCVVIDVICWIFFQFVDYPQVVVDAVFVTGILIFPGILAFIAEIIFMSLHRAKPVAQVAVVENFMRVMLSVIALWMDGGLIELMWIFFVTRSAAFIAYTMIMKYQGVIKSFELPNKKLLKETLKVLPSFLVGAVLFIILSRMDFLVLSLYEQVEVIGYYAVSYRLFDITIIFLSALIMALFPWVAKKFVGSKLHYGIAIKNIIMLFTVSLIIACFTGILFAEDYVSILFAKQFPHPVLLTQLFMAALLFAGMDFVASSVLHASDRQTSDVQSTAVGGVVNVSLLFTLIPVYGIYGAFVAKTVATVLQCVIKFYFIRSIIGKLWSLKEIVKLTLLIAVVTAMVPFFLDAHFVFKLIGSFFVGFIFVPSLLLVFGLLQPLKLLRFYWRNRHANDVKNLPDFLDIMVQDSRRRTKLLRKYNLVKESGCFGIKRGVLGIALYRISRYFWLRNNKVLAIWLTKLSKLFIKIDIPPSVYLGPGLILYQPGNVCISTVMGRNLTCIGHVSIIEESGIQNEDDVIIENGGRMISEQDMVSAWLRGRNES